MQERNKVDRIKACQDQVRPHVQAAWAVVLLWGGGERKDRDGVDV